MIIKNYKYDFQLAESTTQLMLMAMNKPWNTQRQSTEVCKEMILMIS